MPIEQTGELPEELKQLVDLQRQALREKEELRDLDYSADAWQPWRDAAWRVQEGITLYVQAGEVAGEVRSRYETEMLVKSQARGGVAP
ncbi:hypothetical protein [Streptomyces sp. AcH 505]|uniref:hypothetical protein n=1 Tax=Streptomyces sp. AcH 505 TaxID=352211 RepID=UPI0012FECC7C